MPYSWESSLRPGGRNADCHHLLKVMLSGDGCSGEQSLMVRYCDDRLIDKRAELGPGIDFKHKQLLLDGQLVLLQTHLTHSRYDGGPVQIEPSMYRGTSGLMVTYDVTRQESLDYARRWLQADMQNAQVDERRGDIARMLVATRGGRARPAGGPCSR